MILPIEKCVGVEGRSTSDNLNQEKISRQNEICKRPCQNHRDKEKWRIVAFVIEINL